MCHIIPGVSSEGPSCAAGSAKGDAGTPESSWGVSPSSSHARPASGDLPASPAASPGLAQRDSAEAGSAGAASCEILWWASAPRLLSEDAAGGRGSPGRVGEDGTAGGWGGASGGVLSIDCRLPPGLLVLLFWPWGLSNQDGRRPSVPSAALAPKLTSSTVVSTRG
jgi:hypothetical protein